MERPLGERTDWALSKQEGWVREEKKALITRLRIPVTLFLPYASLPVLHLAGVSRRRRGKEGAGVDEGTGTGVMERVLRMDKLLDEMFEDQKRKKEHQRSRKGGQK